ncbi:MAG: hypothetical protein DI604_28175 [Delftia acidovorans]|nr:MAG: hypothetical protein DI604_28175 [Delftia acidovorans]
MGVDDLTFQHEGACYDHLRMEFLQRQFNLLSRLEHYRCDYDRIITEPKSEQSIKLLNVGLNWTAAEVR